MILFAVPRLEWSLYNGAQGEFNAFIRERIPAWSDVGWLKGQSNDGAVCGT